MSQMFHHKMRHLSDLNISNSTVNPKNIDDRSFQYASMLIQHHKEVTKSSQTCVKN